MNLKQIILTSLIFIVIDFIYLSSFSNFFNSLVQDIQGTKIKFNMLGAILCYILLIFGLNYFIIDQKKSILDAFLFGIVIYGVYETTNYALFDKWRLSAVALDTTWGGILYALTTFIWKKYFS